MSRRGVVTLGLLAPIFVGCTASASAVPDDAVPGAAPQTLEVASPTTVQDDPPERSLRDDDVTDVQELAAVVANGAGGDEEWIEIFAELRASSWLANRYPGEYDLERIYSEAWADETALPNERERLSQGVYLDEPLPRLISVVETRRLGMLVELEVVIEADPALVRLAVDDSLQSEFPGGRARGLYTVAQDGPDGRWRIHSVVELGLPDDSNNDPNAEESNP